MKAKTANLLCIRRDQFAWWRDVSVQRADHNHIPFVT